jgi:hypothetical protein
MTRRTRVGGDHLAGVDADPDPENERLVRLQRLDGFVKLGRGSYGAERIVLVHLGDSEDGHGRVADELLHGAAVTRDDRPYRFEIRAHDATKHLGVELGRQGRRVDDVGEQDGHGLSPLGPRRRGCPRALEPQSGVVAQDRLLEPLELGRGIDSEILDERLPRLPIRLQGVRLAACAIQGQHQLAARALAKRVCGDERFELGDERSVAAELELCFEQLLPRGGAKLFEAGDLRLRERLEGEVGERWPPPESERLT